MTQQPTTLPTGYGNPIVDRFAAFWADPDPSRLPPSLAPDVAVYYPDEPEPVRGPEAYVASVEEFLRLIPDLRLSVVEHAANGEHIFIHWKARGTGASGPIELSGIDHIRVRDGIILENFVSYDTARFDELVRGIPRRS